MLRFGPSEAIGQRGGIAPTAKSRCCGETQSMRNKEELIEWQMADLQ